MVLLAQMKQLSLKTQQRFSVFRTCFDVSNIITSHYEYTVKIYKVVISFGTKIPTFLNTSVLLKGVRISAIFLVLRLLIMPAYLLNLK